MFSLTRAASSSAPQVFSFDHSFWSADPSDTHYVGQEAVFNHLGADVLDNAFQGYNACIFAYGQTGAVFFASTLPFPELMMVLLVFSFFLDARLG